MLASGDVVGGQRPSSTSVFLSLCGGGSSRWLHPRLVSFSWLAPATSGPQWLARVKALHVDACGRHFLPEGVFMAYIVPPPLECRGKP
jgi:hypothetical protein